jgi:hypothetical protein
MLLDIIQNFKTNLMKKENLCEAELEDYFRGSKTFTRFSKKTSNSMTCISNTFRLTDNFANLLESEVSFTRGFESKNKFIDIKTEKNNYIGNRVYGMMHGEGVYTCDEFIYSGSFENDVPFGKGLLKLKILYNEFVNYEGVFQGFKDGEGLIFYPNGDIYTGKWKNLMKDGIGRFCLSNGDFYEGSFKSDLYNGPGEIHYRAEKKRLRGEFKDGKEDGEVLIFFENSNKPLKMLYKSGVLLTILEL